MIFGEDFIFIIKEKKVLIMEALLGNLLFLFINFKNKF